MGIWRKRAQRVLLHLLSFSLEFPTGKQSINECKAMNFSRKQEMLKFPIAGLGISGGWLKYVFPQWVATHATCSRGCPAPAQQSNGLCWPQVLGQLLWADLRTSGVSSTTRNRWASWSSIAIITPYTTAWLCFPLHQDYETLRNWLLILVITAACCWNSRRLVTSCSIKKATTKSWIPSLQLCRCCKALIKHVSY